MSVGYSNEKWQIENLPTNQQRTGNNPYLKTDTDIINAFPNRNANDWLDFFPASSGGFNFITNDPEGRYESWTTGKDPLGKNWPQWTLKTDPDEWASQYPDNRPTTETYYVAYNNSENRWTGGIGKTKNEAKAGGDGTGNKVHQITLTAGQDGIKEWLNSQTDPSGNSLTGGSDAKEALRAQRSILGDNEKANEAAPGQRQAAMDSWNYNNVWVPASNYAEAHNETGESWRNTEAEKWNESLDADDGPRQQVADQQNKLGDLQYQLNTDLNNWSSNVANWAQGTRTGEYVDNRNHIFATNGVAGDLAGIAQRINQAARDSGLFPDGIGITEDGTVVEGGGSIDIFPTNLQISMLDGVKNSYGAYYANERVDQWDGSKDGGTYDLIGKFDSNYYLNEYGTSRGLINNWERATQYGDPNSPFDPNNDLDVTARFGTLSNMAWYDYSTDGQSSGARGSAAGATEAADTYTESFSQLTDAEQATIRDQIFGLTGEGESIDWAEDILDPLADETVSFLEGKVAGVFSEKDLEQQDKFQGLATDVLKRSVDELNKQQEKEREMDVFRGLPGFNEIYGSSKTLVNSLLGDSGVGGYLGMMGYDTRKIAGDLEEGFDEMTGLGSNNAEYNWDKWMNESLRPYYEGLEEIQGERVDEDGNRITYDLTTEEGQQFISGFIKDYITPRFNMSKSMSEFVSYLDTLDEDEQNIFQTQTAMNKLKQTAEISAKAQFNTLKESSDLSVFDVDYYFDPTTTLEGISEEDLENNYMNVAETKIKYEKQRDEVSRDWAAAKSNPKSKTGIPEYASAYDWEQWAYFYGADINDKDQFAKLHYQVAGQGKYDPAKDVVSYSTMNEYFNDVLLPLVAEEKLSLEDAAFMQFVTPEEFATEMLEGIDPLENKEEWKKVLETFGIEDMDASLEEVKEYIKEAFETGEAQDIREGIKFLNEQKEDVNQQTLGVDYIQRDPLQILGKKGDIVEGSEEWKELMISYNFSPDLSYDQAVLALKDIEDIDVETTNPLYEVFRGSGFEGSEQDFMNEFFPDATSEDMADLDFLGRALKGDLELTSISDDPFAAMAQFEGFLGGTEGDLYGIEDEDADEVDNTSYFDLFPEEEDYASNTGRGIIDSWTGGLFG